MKEPVRHHYIPQFILRNFKREDGYVSYYDCSKGSVESKRTEEIFMTRNLYRDTINHPDEPVKIENDLARYENEASQIINKFLKEDEVVLSAEEDDSLKLFLAIMGFLADRVKGLIWRWRMQSYWQRILTKVTGYSLIRIMKFSRNCKG